MGTFQTAFTFNKGVVTNGAQLPGQDYVSGLLFYGTAPTGFPSSGVKQCFSIQDAENVGIVSTHSGETKAVGVYLLTNAGAAGDIISIYVQEPINPTNTATNPNKVLLVTYTVLAGDSTVTLLGASIATAIIANQASNGGYSCVSTTGSLAITFRGGLGVFPNSGTPISVVITGTVAGTLTQPTGSGGTTLGIASKLDIFHYHIAEYFRINPTGVVWVGLFSVPGTYTFSEVTTMQQLSAGSIRQIGVYTQARTVVTNGVTDANTLNTVAQTLDNNKMPLSVMLAEDISAVSDLTTLPNLSLLSDEWVSLNISQDGAAAGWTLWQATGKSITNLGALLGAVSAAAVGECIGNPIPKFNITNGTENELPAIANNALFSTLSVGLQTQLDGFRYIYAGTYVGYTGTYFSDSHCAIIANNAYAYIEQNRVEAKLERLLYQAYLPTLKSQLSLNADGTLQTPLVFALQSIGNNAIAPMVQAGEISQVETIINPNQNITVTGKLVVTVYEINNPIARNIEVDINSVTTLP